MTEKLKQDEYRCIVCKELWHIFPEDYGCPDDYPDTCPLCSMSIWEMIRDVYKVDGILEVFRRIWIRIKEL